MRERALFPSNLSIVAPFVRLCIRSADANRPLTVYGLLHTSSYPCVKFPDFEHASVSLTRRYRSLCGRVSLLVPQTSRRRCRRLQTKVISFSELISRCRIFSLDTVRKSARAARSSSTMSRLDAHDYLAMRYCCHTPRIVISSDFRQIYVRYLSEAIDRAAEPGRQPSWRSNHSRIPGMVDGDHSSR